MLIGAACFVVGFLLGYAVCLRRNKAIVAKQLAKLDMFTSELEEWGQAFASNTKAEWLGWINRLKKRYGL